MTQRKHLFHAQKEHIKTNLENGIIRLVLLDIIAIEKDHWIAQLVQKVTFVIFLTQEKHQSHAQKEHTKINVGDGIAQIVVMDITVVG